MNRWLIRTKKWGNIQNIYCVAVAVLIHIMWDFYQGKSISPLKEADTVKKEGVLWEQYSKYKGFLKRMVLSHPEATSKKKKKILQTFKLRYFLTLKHPT